MSFDKGREIREKLDAEERADEAIQAKTQAEELLMRLIEKLSEQSSQAGLSAEQLEAILTKVGLSTAEGMRQSLKPENADHEHISVFFTKQDRARYGSWEQKPKLTRKTFFAGIEEKEDRLTPAEIEAYNAITTNREARNGLWQAKIEKTGGNEQLFITVPLNTDARIDLPPLVLILHELNGGRSTQDVHGLLRQIDHLMNVAQQHGATVAELEASL